MTTYGIWTDAYGFNGASVPGLMFTMGNEALTWERSKTFNIGLDASFFRNSLNINFDYFYKRTSDILLPAIVPGVFGASIAKENRGVMDNQGWGDHQLRPQPRRLEAPLRSTSPTRKTRSSPTEPRTSPRSTASPPSSRRGSP